jgi:ribosomal protein S18 acetylase RimI-like enzyme
MAMPLKVTIRNYVEADREQCRGLWRELAEWHGEIYQDPTIGGEHPEHSFDKHLLKVGADRLWVAVYRAKVVGFAGLIVDGDEAEIEPIVVSKSYRGKGAGTQLIETVVSKAKEMKLRHLNISPVARNLQAIDFYYKLGFVNIGKIEMFMDLTGKTWKSGFKLQGKDYSY